MDAVAILRSGSALNHAWLAAYLRLAAYSTDTLFRTRAWDWAVSTPAFLDAWCAVLESPST